MTGVWILVLLLGIVAAQCPGKYSNGEVAGIAVGVAFATLFLCLILLGLYLLYRRKKQAQPGKNDGATDKRGQSYDNPSFQNDDTGGATAQPVAEQRISFAEKGFGGYVPSPDYRPSNKPKVTSVISTSSSQGLQGSTPNNNNNNDSLKRSLMKLKPSPLSSPHYIGNARTGSQGSLDASCQNIDPEVISVSLQSEDIIGLGFNITGSMRDGIYVSQVHNRGPASESGCIKPGDRIMSITISFENMVYEDALTILSYASPYPVRLQLLKNTPSSSRVDASVATGDDEDALHHPVYRSQSMDDVSKIARDSVFNVRRARSEMKRGSSKKNDQTVPEGTLRKWNAKQNMEAGITGPSLAVNMPDFDINTSNLRMDDQLTTAAVHGHGGMRTREIDLPDGEFNVKGDLPRMRGDVKFDKPNVEFQGDDDDDFQPDELQFLSQIRGEIPMEDMKFNLNDDYENPSYASSGGVDLHGLGNVEGVDLPNMELNVPQGRSGDVNFGRPSGDGQVQINYDPPDVDVDVPSKKSGFKMPGFKLPGFKKTKTPSGDVNLKADVDIPELQVKGSKADINLEKDIDLPDMELGTRSGIDMDGSHSSSSDDVEGPDIKSKKPGLKLPDFNLPSFKKSKSPDADLELEVKGGVDKPDISGDIQLEGGDVDVNGSGFKLPDFNLPSFKKSKSADVDVDFNAHGDVDLEKPNISGDIDVDGPEVKAKGSGFKLPDFNLPSFKKSKSPDVDVDLDVKGGVALDHPDINADIDVEGPEVKAKGPGFKLPDFNLPSFKKSKSPDVDLDLDVKGDVDIDEPNLSGDVDIEDPGVKAKGSGFKMPDFNLPSFKKSKSGDADIDMDIQGDIDIEKPNVSGDIDVDLEGPEVKTKSSGFKLPDFSLPSFKKSKSGDADIDIDIQGDFDIEKPNVSGDIDVDLEGPEVKTKSSGFKLPDFSLPSFKKSKSGDADIDMDIQGDLNIEKPNVSGDIDVDLEGPEVKTKGSGFKLPDFSLPSFKKSKSGDADVDLDIKGDIDLEKPNISGDIDVESPNLKAKGSGFKLPDFNLPSFKTSKSGDADMDLDVRGDIDLERPNLSGDIDVDVEGPEVKTKSTGFKLPEFNLPSLKKPKGPDVYFDADVKGDVDIDNPDISGDIDVEAPNMKAKGSGFKMPDFNLPSFKSPDVDYDADADFDTPKLNLGRGISGDVDLDVDGKDIDIHPGKVNFNTDVDLPDVDVNVKGPNVSGELDAKKGSGFKLPDFKLPGFKKSKGKAPDIDVNTNANLDMDGSLKGGNINMKGPNVDLDARNVDVDIDIDGGKVKKESGFKLPGFKLPSHKKDSDLDAKVNFDADADVNLKGDVEFPDVDIDKPEISREVRASKDHGFSLPDFKLPGFKKSGAKASIEGGDINADLPDLDAEGGIDVNIKGDGVKAKGSGFKFPGFKKSKVEVPDVDVDADLKAGKVNFDKGLKTDVGLPDFDVDRKGGVDLSLPTVSGDMKAPNIDGDLPQVDLDTRGSFDVDADVSGDLDLDRGRGKGSKGFGLKMPDFKLPSFKKPDVDVDVNAPNIEGGINADLDVPDVEGSNARINTPNFHISGLDVDAPSANLDIDAPKVDLPEGDVDVKVKTPKGTGFKLPDFKLPSLHGHDANPPDLVVPSVDAHADANFKGAQINTDVDIPDVNVNVSGQRPDVDIKAPDVKADKKHSGFKLPHFKMPGRKKASVKAPDMSGPGIAVETEAPNYEITGPKLPEAGLGMPGVAMSGYSLSSNLERSVDLPSADVDIQGPSFRHGNKTSGEIDLPSASLPNVSVGDHKFDSPDYGMSGSGVSANVDASEVSMMTPKVSLPDVDASVKVARPDLHLSTDDHEVNLHHADVSANVPDVNLSADVDVPGFGGDLKIKKDDKDKKKKKKREEEKPKKKEDDYKSEKKKSGIQGWWQRRRRRRSSSSSHTDSSDSEDEKKVTVNLPSASISVPSLSMPEASVSASSDDAQSASFSVTSVEASLPSVTASVPSVGASLPDVEASLPSVEASLPDVSASALPNISSETSSKSVDITMTEPKIVGPTISTSLEESEVSVPDFESKISMPDISAVEAPSIEVEGDIEAPSLVVDAEYSSDSDDERQGINFDMTPSVAHEIEIHTEPGVSAGYDIEETSNWQSEISMPEAQVTFPEEPDVTNASMRVNLDQDSILVRDDAGADPTSSEDDEDDEDDQERVSAMLREYLADDPLLMERLGFGSENSNAKPEVSVEGSADASDFLSRNGEALSGARMEIRRRSDSSPERQRKSSSSSSSSRSSSPKRSKSEEASITLPTLESSADWDSESPAFKASTGGIAYDITPSQLQSLSPEEREQVRGDPRGGMAYYVDINDQLTIKHDQDDEDDHDQHPPLVNPRTFETESIHTQLRTNHLTDDDQEDDDDESSSFANFSTSLSKPRSLNTNFSGTLENDSNITSVKTVETTSTTVTRSTLDRDPEGNKTYTVTITTTQMDDSEA